MKIFFATFLLLSFSSMSFAYVPKNKLEKEAQIEISIFELSHPGISVKVKRNQTKEIKAEIEDANGIPGVSSVLREFNSGSVFIALACEEEGCGPDTKH